MEYDAAAWVALAEKLRDKLASYVDNINDRWDATAVQKTAEACQSAYWLHVRALAFEKEVELQQNRFSAD
jgi:hypothetical protein